MFAQRDKKTTRARFESFEFLSSSFSSSEKNESESFFSEKKSFSNNKKKLNSNVFDSTFCSRSFEFRVEKKTRYYKKSRRSRNANDLRKLYFSQIFITIRWFKPCTIKVVWKIKRFQKFIEFLILRLSFVRLIKKLMSRHFIENSTQISNVIRWQTSALRIFQKKTKIWLIVYFHDTNLWNITW
jgi:hypothetical protein